MIGVSEVENRQVLEDLIHTGKLAQRNYGIVHYDSPDARGIDVGLIYDKDQFTGRVEQQRPAPHPRVPQRSAPATSWWCRAAWPASACTSS